MKNLGKVKRSLPTLTSKKSEIQESAISYREKRHTNRPPFVEGGFFLCHKKTGCLAMCATAGFCIVNSVFVGVLIFSKSRLPNPLA